MIRTDSCCSSCTTAIASSPMTDVAMVARPRPPTATIGPLCRQPSGSDGPSRPEKRHPCRPLHRRRRGGALSGSAWRKPGGQGSADHVRQRVEQHVPKSREAPAPELTIDRIPFAQFFRQIAPWRAGPCHPEYAVQRAPVLATGGFKSLNSGLWDLGSEASYQRAAPFLRSENAAPGLRNSAR